ncbi:MAG TPA: TIGR02587 family membrane protein [Acidimicrobiales bacterium]|nr:TIGR02587 family membrane protein [Acidimicrobiales bacterium]
MAGSTATADSQGWRAELADVGRAVAGGMLFGVPLLYTMEVWWIGSFSEPLRTLAALALSFIPVYLLVRISGFRNESDEGVLDGIMDTVETVALGIATAAVMLVVLRELSATTPPAEALGKIVYEATPFSIGIALAQAFLRKGRGGDGEAKGRGDLEATMADVGATLVGAMFVAFNIAPTDEIPMLSAVMGPYWLLVVMAASLVISYVVVFEAGFSNEEQRHSQTGVLQHPITETVASYLIALLAALAMLWFFQRLGGLPWDATLEQVVVLGLPAAVGGAAGRLAI